MLKIVDTGMGIESHQITEVFGLFAQLNGCNVRRGSLGIGLALARSLIELPRGTIEVDSEGPGRGTCFMRVPTAGAVSPVP